MRRPYLHDLLRILIFGPLMKVPGVLPYLSHEKFSDVRRVFSIQYYSARCSILFRWNWCEIHFEMEWWGHNVKVREEEESPHSTKRRNGRMRRTSISIRIGCRAVVSPFDSIIILIPDYFISKKVILNRFIRQLIILPCDWIIKDLKNDHTVSWDEGISCSCTGLFYNTTICILPHLG